MIRGSLVFLFAIFSTLETQASINVYTDRNDDYMKPLVEAFKAQTGEDVNYLTLSGSEIIERLLVEGADSAADIVIVKDMLYLNQLSSNGLLQPMTASTEHIPTQMKSPVGFWSAITMRARTIVFNKNEVDPLDIQTYESLGSEMFTGKLCLRTANLEKTTYNVGLVAGFIADRGEEATKTLLESWMKNLAIAPIVEGGDRAVLRAIDSGECSVGVVNSYYLGQEMFRDEEILNVGIVFADQYTHGTHVNGTGAGIVAASEKTELANEFMSLLLSSSTQELFSEINYDFPVSQDVAPLTPVADWTAFLANQTNWSVVGENVDKALKIIEEVGYE